MKLCAYSCEIIERSTEHIPFTGDEYFITTYYVIHKYIQKACYIFL